MLSGKPPFIDETEYLVYQKILTCSLEFPKNFNPVAKDLVQKILQISPKDRLGSGGRYINKEDGLKKLKDHEFFKGVDFSKLSFSGPPNKEGLIYKSIFDLKDTSKNKISIPYFEEQVEPLKKGKLKLLSPWYYFVEKTIQIYKDGMIEGIELNGSNKQELFLITKKCSVETVGGKKFKISSKENELSLKVAL